MAESHFFAFLKGGGRLTEPKIILDQDGIRRALTRIAFEIVEKNKGAGTCAARRCVKTRGIYLAQRIAAKLGEVEGKGHLLCSSWTLHRGAMTCRARTLLSPDLDPRIAGATVIIVDDVLYTGRTVRAAIEAISHRGRAERSWLCWSIAVTANCRCGGLYRQNLPTPRVMNAFLSA